MRRFRRPRIRSRLCLRLCLRLRLGSRNIHRIDRLLQGAPLRRLGRRLALPLVCLCLGLSVDLHAQSPRPNILWIIAEDLSPHLSSYGETTIQTPHLDAMARDGVRFTNAIVTSPSRSTSHTAMMTGMYPTTLGAQHHYSQRAVRRGGNSESYQKSFQTQVKFVPELFKEAGYFTTSENFPPTKLHGGTSPNFEKHHRDIYDSTNFRECPADQPFFALVALLGGRKRSERQHGTDPEKVSPPPCYPDTPALRRDWADYLNAWIQTDREVGGVLDDLQTMGRARQTIVFFFSDNGILHARAKDSLYEAGVRVPFLMRFGDGRLAKTVRDDLVSQIDIAVTTLALAGLAVPPNMQGKNLFASDYAAREFIVSARDRCLTDVDVIRSVRTKRYKYIRNFLPETPLLEPSAGLSGTAGLEELGRLYRRGKLNALQARVFAAPRAAEELYDFQGDPYELENLAAKPEHAETLVGLRTRLHEWMRDTGDLGLIPEPILADLGRQYGTRLDILRASENDGLVAALLQLAEATRLGDRGTLLDALDSTRPALRYQALTGIGVLGDRDRALLGRVEPFLGDDDACVRIAAALSLARLGKPSETVATLADELDRDNLSVTLYATRALGLSGIETPELRELVEDASKHRYVFTRSLGGKLSRQFRLRTPEIVDIAELLSRPLLEPRQSAKEVTRLLLEDLPAPLDPDAPDLLDQLALLRERVYHEVVFKGWPRDLVERPANARYLEDETIETGKGYRILKLLYSPYPGVDVPALLYEPTELKGKVPAVINLNGHDRGIGKAVPFKQRRCIALAKRGMLALSPEWYGMGELDWQTYLHNQAAGIDLCGRSSVGLFYLAIRQALDIVLEHPHTDPARVAMTGLSGGGWQTIILSALDERVSAAVPVAGYIGIESRIRNERDTGDLEQLPADLLTVADYPHLTAMLLPRPAFLIFNSQDPCCFRADRARPSVYEPVRVLYDRLAPGVEFGFHENFHPGNHNYGLNNRLALYGFLNRSFLAPGERVAGEPSSEGEIRSLEELRIKAPYEKRRFADIAFELARNLPRHKTAQLEKSPEKRQAVRTALGEVLRLKNIQVSEAEALDSPELSSARQTKAWRLRLSNGLTVPLYSLEPRTDPDKGTLIVFADGGRAGIADRVEEALTKGMHVLACDLVLLGECEGPSGDTLMFSTTGRRALGAEVAQVLALGDWASERFEGTVSVFGSGRLSATIALLAGALSKAPGSATAPIENVYFENNVASLRDLLRSNASVTLAPPLYCFGLLEATDIPELRVLNEGKAHRVRLGEPLP